MPSENDEDVEVTLDADGNVVESEEVESDDEPVVEESDEVEGMTKAELKEAQNLYKLLKDPKTQKDVLRVLAKSAGIMEDPPETPQEVREEKKNLLKILEERLGPDLKWLAPKLGGALEEILEQERETHAESFQAIERKEVENNVVQATAKLNRETKGEFSKLENRMNELALEVLPAPGQSVEKYMRNLYAIASSEKGNKVDKSKLADKIIRNASNASERVRSVNNGGQEPSTSNNKGDGKLTLKQAVAAAAKSLEKK